MASSVSVTNQQAVLCYTNTIIRPHRSTTYVDAAYCYGPTSVVCRSVCLSVCRSSEYQWTVHVRRRCGLFVKLLWPLAIIILVPTGTLRYHQLPIGCSVLHSSVHSPTGRFRLQHLPSGTLCRHQPDPLTLLVLLNLDLKSTCLRQHTLPTTVQRYRSAYDSHATRAL